MKLHIYQIMVIATVGCLVLNCRTSTQEKVSKSIPLCNGGVASLNSLYKLPTPKEWNNIGNSHLDIHSQKPKAQQWFNQGLNMLHGFWHLEAYRAFQQVIALDNENPMGYWGIALCQPGFGGSNMTVWKNAIQRAYDLRSQATPMQQDLIEATYVLINNGIEAAQMPFRNLYKNFPNEPEAIAFAAIMLRQHENENTQQEVKQLLENAMKQFPENTAFMHYYVHVMELRSEFAKAIPVAEKMKKLAIDAPHLQHMPGHLYYLNGDYQNAANTFGATKIQESAYHKAEKIPFSANQNYVHNLQFLTLAQAELGNYQTAMKTAKEVAYLTLSNEIPNEGTTQLILYEGRILPALLAIRYHNWSDAKQEINFWLYTPDAPIQNNIVKLYLQAMLAYVQGMEAIQRTSSNALYAEGINEATKSGAELTQLMQQFKQESLAKQNTSEWKLINKTYDIMSMARYELAGWIDNIDKTKPFNETAWKEAVALQNKIPYDEPPRLMYPIEESLARLHKIRGEKKSFQQAKKQALQRRPKSKTIINLI